MARAHWPLLAALVLLWAALLVLYVAILSRTHGTFVYVLDDPYIHMAMAKHFASGGVWGVTPYAFSSSSSSLLWTLVLAGVYGAFGVRELAPLLLNAVAASLLLVTLELLLRRLRVPSLPRAGALVAVVFFAPLPALVFTGLEHVTHALLSLLFVYAAAEMVSAPDAPSGRQAFGWTLVLAPLVTLARFEGLFVVFVACVLLLGRRRFAAAVALGGAALAPVVVYGAVSVANGGFWLPNSVLLKGSRPDFHSAGGVVLALGGAAVGKMVENPHMLGLALISFLLLVRQGLGWGRGEVMLLLLLGTLLLHLQFAAVGWFYRYEAYLVVLAAFVFTVALFGEGRAAELRGPLAERVPARYVGYTLMLLGALMIGRAALSLLHTPVAALRIDQHPRGMGRFFRRYYEGRGVAAHDIGAINFLADLRCLDLYGLGDPEVARQRMVGRYHTPQIAMLAAARNVRVAALYDDWFTVRGRSGLPATWVKVAEWRIPPPPRKGVGADGDRLAFYAVDRAEAPALAAHLREFRPWMPPGVMLVTVGGWTE
jgi:hypothetical protein